MGYTALLVFAGLEMIPNYVYEAAAVDGSTEWKSFRRITLPLLRPVLALVLVITVTGSFQVFDTVAVTTRRRARQRQPRHPVTTSSSRAYTRPVRLCQRPLGDLFIIPAPCAIQLRMLRARIRPGLRGVSHGNDNRAVLASQPQPSPRPT